MKRLPAWKDEARRLRQEIHALYLAYRDPRVPWYAKAFAACVVAYALSPIDLIPDAIPVIGYLDDLILVPLGIRLALKMIPQEVVADCREKARLATLSEPRGWRMVAAVVIGCWIGLAAIAVWLLLRILS